MFGCEAIDENTWTFYFLAGEEAKTSSKDSELDSILKWVEAIILKPLETLEKVQSLDEANMLKCTEDGFWSLLEVASLEYV